MARRKSYQKGSVRRIEYQYGKVFVGRYRERLPGGGWREKSITLRDCKTKKAAQRKLDDILDELNKSNGVVIGGDVLFAHVLDRLWPNYLDTNSIKLSTRHSYDVMVSKWIGPYFREVLLEDVTPTKAGDFMAMLNAEDLSPQYRLNIYSLLRVLFDLAVEYDLIEVSPIRPKVHRPQVVWTEKPLFSVEEATAVINAVPSGFHAAIATLAVTGLRAGELVALRWEDIDFLDQTINVKASVWRGQIQTTKTRSSNAVLSIPSQLVGILQEHKSSSRFIDSDDFVFCEDDGRPLNPDKLRKRAIYPALTKLGIPRHSRASGCHAFRHLAGSVAHRETGSVKLAQQLLRHSSVATTSNIYVHTDQKDMEGVADLLGKVLLEKPVAGTVAETVPGSETIQ